MEARQAPSASMADQGETLRRMDFAHRYAAWLFERAARDLGDHVVDIGAGIGTFTEMIAASGRNVVAVEPDARFAEALRRRLRRYENVEVLNVDAARLDRNAFGAPVTSIVCFNVLEHIPDDRRALTSFRELLAPGGRLFLLVPAHPLLYSPLDAVLGHARRYRKADVRDALVEAGFDLDELRLVNPLGALGWLVSARILRRTQIPLGPLRVYDRLVPLLRRIDALALPVGLSVWAVARRP